VSDDAGVRILLLGGFEVTVDGRPVAADAWRLRKARTLVKLLVLARGHRLHRDALVEVLWPDRDEASATNNLHQALYVARRALAGASEGLCRLRDGVVLLSEGTMPWLDTDAFEAACQRAHQTRDAPDYRVAAELYRGDLLPEDRFEDWAEGPRADDRPGGERPPLRGPGGVRPAPRGPGRGVRRRSRTGHPAALPGPAHPGRRAGHAAGGGAAATGRAATRMPTRPPHGVGDGPRPEQTSFIGAGASWPGSARPSAAPGCSP
jgi:hypothetical protein